MNEKHPREALVRQLCALGFPPAVELQLRLHSCLAPGGFVLFQQQERSGDLLLVRAAIRPEDAGGYTCRYYDATLRRAVEVPEFSAGDLSARDVDAAMQRVPWRSLPDMAKEGGPAAEELVSAVEQVMEQLRRLEATAEGRVVVQRLTARHWLGTPLEPFCTGLTAVRSAFEVHQRFYLFEGGSMITLEEAYRFLLYRWRERRMQEAEKELRADRLGKGERTQGAVSAPKGKARRTSGEERVNRSSPG